MVVKTRKDFSIGEPSRFEEGKFVHLELDGERISVIRLRGELKAVRNRCPHKGAPVCRGFLGGTWPPSAPGELLFEKEGEVLVCPWHGYEYSLVDGRELFQKVPTRLRFYPVSIVDETVYVTL